MLLTIRLLNKVKLKKNIYILLNIVFITMQSSTKRRLYEKCSFTTAQRFFFKVYLGNKTARLNDIEFGFYYTKTMKYILYYSSAVP